MGRKGNKFLELSKFFIHLIVFLLTLSSSRYHCEEIKDNSTVKCFDYGSFGNEDKSCENKAFILSASGNYFILCPWSGGVITSISISNIAAMIYISIAVFQILKKKYVSEKFMIYSSFLILPVLIIATTLMLRDFYHASEQCGKIEHEYFGKRSVDGHCSNRVFGVTFLLSMVSALVFAYEAMQNFYNYRFKSNLVGDYSIKDRSLSKRLVDHSDNDDDNIQGVL